jgi:hypothetical protein
MRTTNDQTGDPTQSESDALISEMRDRIASLERQLEHERQAKREHLRLLAAALERIPHLEASQEPRESPVSPGPSDTLSEFPGDYQTGTKQRSVADEPSSHTNTKSARGHFARVGKLPLWQYAVGVLFCVLAYPFILSLRVGLLVEYGSWDTLPLVLLVLPGIFGYWVGRKLSNARFWYHVSAVGVFIGLTSAIATLASMALIHALWVESLHLDLSDLVYAGSAGLLYIFAAVLGNAVQLRDRDRHPEGSASGLPARPPAAIQSWSPRQQAIVGLVGTIISALIGLVGTIISMNQ